MPGAPLKLLRFAGFPVVSNVNTMGVLKVARHPNAALVLLNWSMSKEGHDFVAKTTKRQSLRTDVPDQLPEAIRTAELVGTGAKGPGFIVSGPQAVLNVDLYADLDVWTKLPNGGISQDEFVTTVNNYVKEWESKNGGPQKAIPLSD